MLVHHWSHPTTPAGPGWDIVQSGVVRLTTEKGFSARAALGEAETIRVTVDDDSGTADYKTLHRWYMVETATAGQQLVWNGYISDQWIDRGASGDLIFPFGAGRRWELEITQEQTILGFRVIRAGGDRPGESPGARLLWLLNSDYLKTVYDHGLIDWDRLNAYPAMTPSNYEDQFASDVLRDISLWTGFNHYARYRDASADIELAFYDQNTNGTLDLCDLVITNDPGDTVDNVTSFRPFFEEPRLHRKGDRVAAGVLVRGKDKIRSYDYSLPTSYEFGFRDIVVTDNNITTQAGADRLRDRLLEQHNEQDERGTSVRILVPSASLNVAKHGQLARATFVNWPDWDNRPVRVVSKAFSRPENDTQDEYEVDLELSPIRVLTCESDSFEAFYDEEKNPVMASTQTFNVTAPTANPSVIVALLDVMSAFISVGPLVSINDSGAWNGHGSWSVPSGSYWHEVIDTAYQPYSGGTPEALVGTLSFVEGTAFTTTWTVSAVAIETASTTPVQTATNGSDTAGSVTLSSAPTPGNLLVMFQTVRGHPTIPPDGWTLLADVSHQGGTGGGTDNHIYAFSTCVPASGMSTLIQLQPLDALTERHAFVSEWLPI